MRQTIKRTLASLGYAIGRIDAPGPPAPEHVRDVIRRMWPVTTDIPLIRAGGDADGAYIIPDDLAGIRALFSPGVDAVAKFEEDMAALGMECYLADASVSAPPVANPRFHFEHKFLGLVDAGMFFRLDSWVDRLAPGDDDLMLQIDIEGAEWLVLASASDALLSRFRVIVAEYHMLHQMTDPLGSAVIAGVLDRLARTHHVVHAHPNNDVPVIVRGGIALPDILEVTYLRKDRAVPTGFANQFPHPLDIINRPGKPAIPLPASWHGPA